MTNNAHVDILNIGVYGKSINRSLRVIHSYFCNCWKAVKLATNWKLYSATVHYTGAPSILRYYLLWCRLGSEFVERMYGASALWLVWGPNPASVAYYVLCTIVPRQDDSHLNRYRFQPLSHTLGCLRLIVTAQSNSHLNCYMVQPLPHSHISGFNPMVVTQSNSHLNCYMIQPLTQSHMGAPLHSRDTIELPP